MSVVEGFEKVTRVVLVSGKHPEQTHVIEQWADSWEIHLQDDGHTLKLFATGKGHKARQEASEALGRDLVNGMVKSKGRADEIMAKAITTPTQEAADEVARRINEKSNAREMDRQGILRRTTADMIADDDEGHHQ